MPTHGVTWLLLLLLLFILLWDTPTVFCVPLQLGSQKGRGVYGPRRLIDKKKTVKKQMYIFVQ